MATPNASRPCEQSSIAESLAAYTPAGLPAETWRQVADAAVALVLRGQPATIERARKGIEALAAAAAYLASTSIPLTVDNLVSDATISGLDSSRQAAGQSEGTRGNLRGRLRRLQATHRGVPTPARREDGDRIADLPTAAAALPVLVLLSAQEPADRQGVAALQTVVGWARARRRGRAVAEPGADTWRDARAYGAAHGVNVTATMLKTLATHEVLQEAGPVVDLVATCQLTRRDLDLALPVAAGLPETPDLVHRSLLRG